jgi:hypothetical protein
MEKKTPIRLEMNLTFSPFNNRGVVFWISWASKLIRPMEIPQKLPKIPIVTRIAGEWRENRERRGHLSVKMPVKAAEAREIRTKKKSRFVPSPMIAVPI